MKRNAFVKLASCLLAVLGPVGLLWAAHVPTHDMDPRLVGWWPGYQGSSFTDVEVRDGRAYAINATGELVIFDISNPSQPVAVGRIDFDGEGKALALEGNFAYVASGTTGLHVINIAEPSQPKWVSALVGASSVDGVVVQGHYAYAVAGNEGFKIIDIQNPAHPTLMGGVEGLHGLTISVAGGMAYLNVSGAGLAVVDIGDPAAPRHIGTYVPETGIAMNATAYEDRLYVAVYESGLLILDASDPSALQPIGSFPGLIILDLAVLQDMVYAATPEGLVVIDVTNPSNVRRLGRFETGERVDAVSVQGDAAVLAGSGLRILDLSDLSAVVEKGRSEELIALSGIALLGSHAYLTDSRRGLRVFDISDPSTPRLTGTADSAGTAYKIAVAGNYAMITAEGSGLEIYDVASPENPRRIAIYPTGPTAQGLALSATHAFVAVGDDGLQIVDITDPTKPKGASNYRKSSTWISDVVLTGNIAMLADGSGGLTFLDVSDPAKPVELSALTIPNGAGLRATISGRSAYALAGHAGAEIYAIDLIDPRKPVLDRKPVARIRTSVQEYPLSVLVQDNILYANAHAGGIYIFDAAAPPALRRLGAFAPVGSSQACAVSGSHAFIAAGDGGLQVFRLDLPSISPRLGSYVPGAASVTAVEVANNLAYLGTSSKVLDILDVSNPAEPSHVGFFNGVGSFPSRVRISEGRAIVASRFRSPPEIIAIINPAQATAIGRMPSSIASAGDFAWVGNLVYLAVGNRGLAILDISEPTNPREVGMLDTPGLTRGIAVANQLAYLTDDAAGIHVIDVTDPAKPVLLIQVSSRGSGHISFYENFLFVLGAGMEIFDVRDPRRPVFVSRFDSPQARGVTFAGRLAYLADEMLGLRIVDISDPAQPRYIGGNSAFGANQIAISGSRAYVAGHDGLLITEAITAVPHLGNISLEDGSFNMWLYGANGQEVRLQRASSIAAWQDWDQILMGEIPRPITADAGSETRFFRAVPR